MKRLLLLVTLAALVAAPLAANAARNSKVLPLTLTPSTVASGASFDVSGCGLNASLGPIVLAVDDQTSHPTIDRAGCIFVSGVLAVQASGIPLAPGSYTVEVLQFQHSQWRYVAGANLLVT